MDQIWKGIGLVDRAVGADPNWSQLAGRWKNEVPIYQLNGAGLIFPKTTVVREWYSASYKAGAKTTLRAGYGTSTTVENLTPIDTGTLIITSHRVVFLGQKRSVEWRQSRLLGFSQDLWRPWVFINVSNRQRTFGFQHGPNDRTLMATLLTGASALYNGDVRLFAWKALTELNELIQTPPPVPEDVPVNPRVGRAQQQWGKEILPPLRKALSLSDGGSNAAEGDADALSKIPASAAPEALSGDEGSEPELLDDEEIYVEEERAARSEDGRDEQDVIVIAGNLVPDPAEVLLDYLSLHDGTVENYDLRAGSFSDHVTLELIQATRSPWMNSRISNAQANWFIERGESAPWSLLPHDADLIDADPLVHDELYDRALRVWAHFASAAPRGVAGAKISKVLYLMRPGLFPILDSRLKTLYDGQARDAGRRIAAARPEVASSHMFWEAIRQDLVKNAEPLGTLRNEIRLSAPSEVSDIIGQLTDLRLLDILSWHTPTTDDEASDE